MKPEILLKAYVQYQCDDAFRELVAGTLDEVYSTALRIVQGPPHLVEETVLRVYQDLSRHARGLSEGVELAPWLREHTCKLAVGILHEEDRPVDRDTVKHEKEAASTPDRTKPAPPGLAIRVCQGILLGRARPKNSRLPYRAVWEPGMVRRLRIVAAAVCILGAIVALGKIPFHKRNPIVKGGDVQLTPASFAQLASPEERDVAMSDPPSTNTNAQINKIQK
jgi:hypothetical protein